MSYIYSEFEIPCLPEKDFLSKTATKYVESFN